MTQPDDSSLTNSVEKLNDTAVSLTALMKIVDKNQQLLVENHEATLENTDAISLRSTKEELLNEVQRLAIERKKDRLKTKLTVGGSFFVSLLLILAIFLTANEYKSSRKDANTAYAQAAQSICLQRNKTWDAMHVWIAAQKSLEVSNSSITPELRARRIVALDKLLKSFPDVDCSIDSKLIEQSVTTSSLDFQLVSNLLHRT
jgi:hypothetical protein